MTSRGERMTKNYLVPTVVEKSYDPQHLFLQNRYWAEIRMRGDFNA
jgi:hypothetical protein